MHNEVEPIAVKMRLHIQHHETQSSKTYSQEDSITHIYGLLIPQTLSMADQQHIFLAVTGSEFFNETQFSSSFICCF